MKKIMLIAEARPKFMKLTLIAWAFDTQSDEIFNRIVHTGSTMMPI